MKVKDIMQTENLPIIDEKASLKSAIFVMNEGKMGNVLIVDGARKTQSNS